METCLKFLSALQWRCIWMSTCYITFDFPDRQWCSWCSAAPTSCADRVPVPSNPSVQCPVSAASIVALSLLNYYLGRHPCKLTIAFLNIYQWIIGHNLQFKKVGQLSVDLNNTYFHCILFLDFFSISPIPSSTFVMSYIRRFCLTFKMSAAYT